MHLINPEMTAALSPYPALIEALRQAFARDSTAVTAPPRHHHTIQDPAGSDRTLLLMPSWGQDASTVLKMVNVVPENAARNLPAIQAQVMVANDVTGAWETMIDGGTLTARRTAAASALAADYLCRKDAKTLLIIGTGRLAPELVNAHQTLRPSLKRILIWGRNPEKAAALAQKIDGASAIPSIEAGCAEADLISCATLGTAILLRGTWIRPGTHIDLVGAYRRDLRECDSETVARAAVFVDTQAGARGEAGDLYQAWQEGYFDYGDIHADLHGLCKAAHSGREHDAQITLFKSVGASLEDYAAAKLIQANLSSPDSAC